MIIIIYKLSHRCDKIVGIRNISSQLSRLITTSRQRTLELIDALHAAFFCSKAFSNKHQTDPRHPFRLRPFDSCPSVRFDYSKQASTLRNTCETNTQIFIFLRSNETHHRLEHANPQVQNIPTANNKKKRGQSHTNIIRVSDTSFAHPNTKFNKETL